MIAHKHTHVKCIVKYSIVVLCVVNNSALDFYNSFFYIVIMRIFKIKNGNYAGEHIIFDSIQECIEKGYTPKVWYECNTNDWAIADDGYVLQLLSKSYIKNRHNQITWLYRFCNGTGAVYIDRHGTPRPYNFYGAVAKSKKSTLSEGGVYVTPKLKLWFSLVKAGADPNEAYRNVYKREPNIRRINLILENKKIKSMIAKEMVPVIGTINEKLLNKTGKSLDQWFAEEVVDLITTDKLSPKERLANIKFLKEVFANALGFKNKSIPEEIPYEEIRPSLGTNQERNENNVNSPISPIAVNINIPSGDSSLSEMET